jgi:asparagine synthase (glutamine-hydrolysing)
LFLEPVEVPAEWIDPLEAVRVIEDYKPLDVESAAASLALLRGLRARYPEWKHLIDGDGGDENLKDYPIEENPELTIRSVVSNPFLYQEGWGVGTFKHSRTYSGGQSRACTRAYAPARRYGFEGFSPFTRPNLVRIAAGLPFAALAGGDVERLYALKGEIVGRGIRELTGFEMPIFPKRRFQHGAVSTARRAEPAPYGEADYRRQFLGLYA